MARTISHTVRRFTSAGGCFCVFRLPPGPSNRPSSIRDGRRRDPEPPVTKKGAPSRAPLRKPFPISVRTRLVQALRDVRTDHLTGGLVRVVALVRAARGSRRLEVDAEPAVHEEHVVAVVRE